MVASARLRAATSAIARSVTIPASRADLACSAATLTESGQSGAVTYGSSCSASTRRSRPAEDLPNPYTSAVSASPARIFTYAS